MKSAKIAWMALALALALSLFASTALADSKGGGKPSPKPTQSEKVKPTKTEAVRTTRIETPKPTKAPKVMHTRWGEIDQQQLDALKLAYYNTENWKAELKRKVKTIAKNRTALGLAMDGLKASGAALTDDQLAEIKAGVNQVKLAQQALQAARHEIVKARKAYLDARKNKDAAAAIVALEALNAHYDMACQKADGVSDNLESITANLLG